MRSRLSALVFVLAIAAAPARAETQPAAWSQGRAIADWTSTGLVAAQLGADAWSAARSDRPWPAVRCFALRTGVSVAGAELAKHTVSRTRPDGSDRKSFYSEHSALVTASSGWRLELGIPIAIGAGYLRMGAAKHYATDVAIGALAGVLASQVCAR